MYFVCYTSPYEVRMTWELVSSETAMRERVRWLTEQLNVMPSDIYVFHKDSAIDLSKKG